MTKSIYTIILFFLLSAIVVLQPGSSYAEIVTPDTDLTEHFLGTYSCDFPSGQFTEAIIKCIEIPVRKAVLKPGTGLAVSVAHYSMLIFGPLALLAMMILGIRVMNGERNARALGISFLIRLGIIFFLGMNVIWFATKSFDIFDQIVAIGNKGVLPWTQIDLFLNSLMEFGTDDPASINKGIVLLLNGSFLSKNLGAMLTIVGVFIIFYMLLFSIQAVYLYISSVIGFAVLIIIFPIVFTFYIFHYKWTERFFTKWFDIALSLMLTPLLMFAFLGIFMDTPSTTGGAPTPGALTKLVDDIFTKLGGKDYVQRCLRVDQPFMSSWLMPTDPNFVDDTACPKNNPNCTEKNKDSNSVQTFMNPLLYRSLNYSPLYVPMIDCGINDRKIKIAVFQKMLELLIYVVLIQSMLSKIPSISSDLSKGVSTSVSDIMSPVHTALNMAGR